MNWGDVPTWLGVGVALIAGLIALRTYRQSVEVRRDQLNDSRRDQASKLFAWIETPYIPVVYGSQYPILTDWQEHNVRTPDGLSIQFRYQQSPVLHLENASQSPLTVTNVRVLFEGILDPRAPATSNSKSPAWIVAGDSLGALLVGNAFKKADLHTFNWNPAFDNAVSMDLPGFSLVDVSPTIPTDHEPIAKSLQRQFEFVLDAFAFESKLHLASSIVAVIARVVEIDITDAVGRRWRRTVSGIDAADAKRPR